LSVKGKRGRGKEKPLPFNLFPKLNSELKMQNPSSIGQVGRWEAELLNFTEMPLKEMMQRYPLEEQNLSIQLFIYFQFPRIGII